MANGDTLYPGETTELTADTLQQDASAATEFFNIGSDCSTVDEEENEHKFFPIAGRDLEGYRDPGSGRVWLWHSKTKANCGWMTDHPDYVEPTIGISEAEATLLREIDRAERAQQLSDAIAAEARQKKMDATAAALAAKDAAAKNLQDKEAGLARARTAAEAQDRNYDRSADIARAEELHRRQLLDIRDDTIGMRATAPTLQVGDASASSTAAVPQANASQALAPTATEVVPTAVCHIAAAPCTMVPSAIEYRPTNRFLSSLAEMLGCSNINGLPPMRRRRK